MYSYSLITEAKLRQALSSMSNIVIETIAEKTHSGLKYWLMDLKATSDNSRMSLIYAQRSDGGYWYIGLNNIDYSKVAQTSVEEVMTIIKNAKQSTTSNIEDTKFNVPEINFNEEAPAAQTEQPATNVTE